MCQTCKEIEASGVDPCDMLDRGLRLDSLDRHGEPVFVTGDGRHWTLERHAIYESLAFVPYVGRQGA